MKFQFDLIIDRSRADVWRALNDSDFLRQWQPTLTGVEQLSGQPGQAESTFRLTYQENRQSLVVTGTVIERREPEFLAFFFESRLARQMVANRLETAEGSRTRLIVDVDFRFKGLLKLLTPLMHGTIEKRLDDDFRRFQRVLETQARA